MNTQSISLKAFLFALLVLLANWMFFSCKKDVPPDQVIAPPADTTNVVVVDTTTTVVVDTNITVVGGTLNPLLDSIIGTHIGTCHTHTHTWTLVSINEGVYVETDTTIQCSINFKRINSDLVKVTGCVSSFDPISLPVSSKNHLFEFSQFEKMTSTISSKFHMIINLDDRTIFCSARSDDAYNGNYDTTECTYHF